jgi:hypothetical protein
MSTETTVEWQTVQKSNHRETMRLYVPGGWLYLVNEFGQTDVGGWDVIAQSMAFVPADPLARRIENGLVDARPPDA